MANAVGHVSAGQPHSVVIDHQRPLTVPPYPWYY